MKYKFVDHVQPALFDVTKGAWLSQINSNQENVSATYYTAGLEYTERTVHGDVNMGDGGGCLCAVVEEGVEYASALLVVSHAKAKSEIRMLDVYVQPDLNLADSEPNYAALAWIAATAIVGCLGLTYGVFPSRQLKIHTAFPLDAQFMTAVATAIFSVDKYSEHYDVKSHGNWLMVSKKPGADGAHLQLVGTAS
ncbi:hypothetical protein [Stenotrophomonas sp.]|uniref:hypothetical protein n=1 Tax=Stenotrophomonas sp. TaxID=69392 RepID=UPI00289CE3F0|nr:hypothetical protein [Stenotrophomonas sp.]